MAGIVECASWTLRSANKSMCAVCANTIVALGAHEKDDQVYFVSGSKHRRIEPTPVMNEGNVQLEVDGSRDRGVYTAAAPISRGDVLYIKDPLSTTVRSVWAPKVKGLDIYAGVVQPVYTALTINTLE